MSVLNRHGRELPSYCATCSAVRLLGRALLQALIHTFTHAAGAICAILAEGGALTRCGARTGIVGADGDRMSEADDASIVLLTQVRSASYRSCWLFIVWTHWLFIY